MLKEEPKNWRAKLAYDTLGHCGLAAFIERRLARNVTDDQRTDIPIAFVLPHDWLEVMPWDDDSRGVCLVHLPGFDALDLPEGCKHQIRWGLVGGRKVVVLSEPLQMDGSPLRAELVRLQLEIILAAHPTTVVLVEGVESLVEEVRPGEIVVVDLPGRYRCCDLMRPQDMRIWIGGVLDQELKNLACRSIATASDHRGMRDVIASQYSPLTLGGLVGSGARIAGSSIGPMACAVHSINLMTRIVALGHVTHMSGSPPPPPSAEVFEHMKQILKAIIANAPVSQAADDIPF